MARDTTIKATIDIGANISEFQKGIKNIQDELNKLNIGSDIEKDFNNTFKKLETEIQNIVRLTKNNELSLIDRKEIESSFKKLEKEWDQLTSKLENKKISSASLKQESAALTALKKFRDQYNDSISGGTKKIADQTQKYNNQLKVVKQLANDYSKLNEKTGALVTKKTVADQELQNADALLKKRKGEVAQLEAAAKAAEDLLKNRKQQEALDKENFDKDYVAKHGNRKGIVAARDKYLANQAKQYEDAQNAINDYNQAIEKEAKAYDLASINAKKAQKDLDDNATAVKNAESSWQTAKKTLSSIQGVLTRFTNQEFTSIKKSLQLDQFGIDPNTIQSYDQLEDAITQLSGQDQQAAIQVVKQLQTAAAATAPAMNQMGNNINQAGIAIDDLTSRQKQIDQMRDRILQFFSIGNAIQLFKRAVRSAIETVKDLDKVMTETAVVTEFSVGDMWNQLPEYTKRANELGVSIHDVYEASTLYYQQGLKTNEVTQITNSTLRMARIAGLEAAEATDRMTNALRGFNMEINEANADNIADVYSKLAAISASNVDEISTAMTKVASLANSANMQFENTAAFLAQIIETTRESAETAGTALKTVVARFSEVKDLYSKGELFGTDEEGEEVDVNKVSKALRTAGINLNEFLVGNKGLDAIFMELASKWDDLDIVQQRYIATMAAGSRQQSRFIALMSDYKRTLELTQAAQDANGASLEQYGKTLESLETKTARLKNAWDQFLMSIANNSLIKGAVDALTGLVNIFNNLTDFFGGKNGLLKSITSITMALGGLKLGRNFFNALFGNPLTNTKGWIGQIAQQMRSASPVITKQGALYGTSFFKGFRDISQQGLKNTFLGMTGKSDFTAKQLGIKEIDFSDTRLDFSGLKIPSEVSQDLSNQLASVSQAAFTTEQKDLFNSLSANLANGDFVTAQKQAKELGVQLKLTDEQAEKCGVTFKATGASVQSMSMMFAVAGGILVTIGSVIEKLAGKQNFLSRATKYLGIALMTIPTVLKVVEGAIRVFATNATAAISSIPIIGWIAAAITALAALGVAIAQSVDTQAKKANRASEALEALQQEVSNTKNAFEELQNGLESIEQHTTTLEELAIGTAAWKEQVILTNQEVLELINKYKELQVASKNGVLTITNAEEVTKQYEQMVALIQQQENAATFKELKEWFELDTKFSSRNKDTNGELQKLIDEVNAGNITSYQDLQDKFYSKDNLQGYQSGQITKYGDSDKAFAELLELVKKVNTFDQQTKSFYVQIGVAAVEMASLTEEEQKYSDALVNNTSIIDELSKSAQGAYGYIGNAKKLKDLVNQYSSDEDRRKEEQLYKDYVVKTFNINRSSINGKGEFEANGRTYTVEDIAQGYQAYRIEQEIAPEIKNIASTLNKLSKDESSGGLLGRTVAKAFEDASGGELNLSDIMSLIGESTENWRKFASETPEQLKTNLEKRLDFIYNELGGEEALGSIESFKDNLVESLASGLNNYKYAMQDVTRELNQDLSDFSSDVAKKFTNTVIKYGGMDKTGFGKDILVKFKDMGLAGNELERAAEQFSLINLTSINDIESFSEALQSLGIEVAEQQVKEFVDYVIETVGALNILNLDNFKEQIYDINILLQTIQNGEHKREFTQEEYDLIKTYGGDVSQFLQTGKEEYTFTGTDMTSIYKPMLTFLGSALSDSMSSIEAKLKMGSAFDFSDEAVKNIQQSYQQYLQYSGAQYSAEEENRRVKKARVAAIQRYYGQDLNLLQKPELLGSVDEMSNELLDSILAWVEDTINEAPDLLEQKNGTPKLQRSLDGMQGIASTFGGEGQDLLTDIQAMVDLIQNSSISDTFKNQYIMALNDPTLTEQIKQLYAQQAATMAEVFNDANYWAIDSVLLESMTNELSVMYDLGTDQAAKFALENINLNTGLEEIVSTYENWHELLNDGIDDKSIQSTKQYQETIANLEKSLKQMLSIKGQLGSDFINSKETIALLESVATGDLDAVTKLGQSAAQHIRKNQFKFNSGTVERNKARREAMNNNMSVNLDLEPEVTEESFIEIENTLFDFINELDPNIDITTQLDSTTWDNAKNSMIDQMNTMLAAGEITADQMQDYFSAIGFVPDVKYNTETVTSHMYGYYPRLNSNGDVDVIEYEYDAKQDIKVPEITDINYKGPRSSFVSPSIQNTMNQNAKGPSTKSGSESKPKLWKNPYDELYNLQQHINDALREREQLEHKYQDMLKDHTKTSEDLVENTLREVAALQRRLALEKQMLAGRKRQVANVLGEMFEDSEGNRTTLGAMGVGKYANYDVDAGVIQIDYDAIDQIVDENLGSAIEQYISRLEELQGQINDTEDAIEEISDDLVEIKDRGKEEYLNFEQKVYDAIVHAREKEIETLEAINDAISDAASKTISAIQDEISKERQARENDKAEEDILDKEMRLAYLQRDTSGANDLEIKKLTEEISNDQQSYQDKIIDQTIQEMQDEATRAEQQRQAQIDILNEQLEWDQNYGKIWEDVQDKLRGAFDDDGRIKVDSGLYQLLSSDDGLIGKSEFGALQWKEDLAEQVAIAMQGLQNYTLTAARNEGRLKLADGTELSYNPKSGGWYNDKTKKEYTDSDLEWDYDAQAYKIRQKPIVNMPTNDTSVGLSQPSKTTDATPTEPIDEGVIGKITNTYGWVNVRSSVDTSSYSNVIGHTNTGEQLDVIGYGDYGWYKVKLPNGQIGYTARHQNGTQLYSFNAYAHGGLADFTGPAWLDGSKSRPEMVLDAADTQNFIALKDILASILRNAQSGNTKASSGDNYFNIDIQAEIDSDYDVDQLANRIKKQIVDDAMYRNVNVISQMR